MNSWKSWKQCTTKDETHELTNVLEVEMANEVLNVFDKCLFYL